MASLTEIDNKFKPLAGQHIGFILAVLLLLYWFFVRGHTTGTVPSPVQQQLTYTHNDYGPIWGEQPFHQATW